MNSAMTSGQGGCGVARRLPKEMLPALGTASPAGRPPTSPYGIELPMSQGIDMSEVLPNEGIIVVYDLEYTAWEGSHENQWSRPNEHREVIEIGAIQCRASDFSELAEFSCIVKPAINPILSDYITNLTGITNVHLAEDGIPFDLALKRFLDFSLPAPLIVSNGPDGDVILENYTLLSIVVPDDAKKFRNIRETIRAAATLTGEITSYRLPSRLGLELKDDQPHRALSDARSVRMALAHLRQRGLL